MKKSQIKLLIIFALSVSIVIGAQAFAQTTSSPVLSSPNSQDANSFLNTTFWQNIVVTLMSAILAFIGGLALARMTGKKGSGKKLSYTLSIENGLIKVEKKVREKVKVFYESEEIENLYDVRFHLENTGDRVVKSQEIRFEFPDQTRILDFSFDPEPEPELGVAEITNAGLKSFEKKIQIGHLEKSQSVGVRFTATSAVDIKDEDIKPHPRNPEGDVEFESGTITKAISDKEQAAKFLSLCIFYIIVPPILSINPIYGDLLAAILRFVILIQLFPLILPFSKIIADIMFRLISKTEEGKNFVIDGGSNNTVISGDGIKYTVVSSEKEETTGGGVNS